MKCLQANDVVYAYQNKYQTVRALNGVSADFILGKMYAIIGASGSGKTTFLSLLAGLDVPSAGSITWNGESTTRIDRDNYRLEYVSVIYQNFNLFFHLTVLENAAYPLYVRKMAKREADILAREKLLSVGLKDEQFRRFPNMLSGGEQQRVAIARALVNNPSVIIADEPTGNLDPARSLEIMMLLEQINALGTTVMVVTHERELVNRFTKRVVAISEGRIISDGMDGYYLNEEE